MANNEKTGKSAGQAASRVMRGNAKPGDAKKASASALTQRPDHKKKK